MSKHQQLIDEYRIDRDFDRACRVTAVPKYIAYMWLRKSGALTLNESTMVGTSNQRKGAQAELEFQSLVPAAKLINTASNPYNPGYDFRVGDITVDIKYSSGTPVRGGRVQWSFRHGVFKIDAPDFIAFFAIKPGGTGLRDGYRLFLFPNEFLSDRKGTVSFTDLDKVSAFEVVDPSQLASVFEEMTSA